MKQRLYWRPKAVSRNVLVLIAIGSIAGLVAVERLQYRARQSWHEEKLAAARLAEECMQSIKRERLSRGQTLDPEIDPAGSGMLGNLMTPVTTVAGHMGSKQTSVNPNFAACIVDMLKRAGVKPGDAVAVGYTGSFPAMNTSLLAALKTLDLRPVIIASAGASQFGANDPEFFWIDMERHLFEQKLNPYRSVACSIGGYEDLGLGMTEEARQLVLEGIERNNLALIQADEFAGAIEERMKIYQANNPGMPYKAYINVGGGTISVGRSLGKKLYSPGLNLTASAKAMRIDSVMSRFMREGVPVIHLVNVDELAVKYDLPLAPQTMPMVGEGNIYVNEQYNRWLAGGVLLAILLSLRAVILTDIGARLFRAKATKSQSSAEPMV